MAVYGSYNLSYISLLGYIKPSIYYHYSSLIRELPPYSRGCTLIILKIMSVSSGDSPHILFYDPMGVFNEG
jgi:hypothetical protein